MPTVSPSSSEHVVVIDEANAMRLWLEEKVARRELTPAEADRQLEEYEGQGKTWIGPFKDSFGSGKLIYKLARDMKSWRGAEAGVLLTGTAFIGAVACGPLLIALAVGIGIGIALSAADEHWGLSDRLGEAYEVGLIKLGHVWHELGADAGQRFKQLENSRMVHDLSADARQIAAKLGREGDWVRWRLTHL